LAAVALCTVHVTVASAQQNRLRIVQSNSAGDNLHIIDAITNKVVGEIKGIEAPHGLAVSPDGSRIFISEEAGDTVVVVDGKTMNVIKKIPLSGNPNLIDITPDGRRAYVAIAPTWNDLSSFPQIKANPTGGVDVIDLVSLENIKTIPIKGGVHDLNVTPDGKYVVAGSSRGGRPAANAMNFIDTSNNEVAWTVSMAPSPSPMAISKKPDGSTDKIYVQNGRDNGFAVVDFATRVVGSFIPAPTLPPAAQNVSGPPSPSHGIMVTPDQKTLLVNSRLNSTLYAYSLPDLKLLGGAVLGGKGAGWLSVSPDGKTAYVANEHTNDMSVVDVATLKEVARVPVGWAPARNAVWLAP
jgi:YVTN family beta-propeller protein